MPIQAFPLGAEEHSCGSAGQDLSLEELDQRDQDYRADLDHNQRPSNIIMLRMLPPNATANEVSVYLLGMFVYLFVCGFMMHGSSC